MSIIKELFNPVPDFVSNDTTVTCCVVRRVKKPKQTLPRDLFVRILTFVPKEIFRKILPKSGMLLRASNQLLHDYELTWNGIFNEYVKCITDKKEENNRGIIMGALGVKSFNEINKEHILYEKGEETPFQVTSRPETYLDKKLWKY